jgi:dolichol-phosphate mannosyltransferase
MSSKTISICIPTFNEAENLPTAVERVEKVFKEALPNHQLEIVVTDNASSDDTWKVAQKLAESRAHFRAFRFSRNFGFQNSVFAGLALATGDATVTLDADLEDPPEVIPRMVEQWEAGFDVVYGVRKRRHGSLPLRFLFFVFYWILNRLTELRIPRNTGDFRLLDRKVVNALRALPERNLYLRGLVAYLGFSQCPLPYERHPRTQGESKFNGRAYLLLAIDAVTAFTTAPLRFMGLLGFTLFFISAGLGIYYLVAHFIWGTPVQGFTTLVILITLLQSMNFIFFGVMGEYLSRIFDDAKNRPRVIISESLNSDDDVQWL